MPIARFRTIRNRASIVLLSSPPSGRANCRVALVRLCPLRPRSLPSSPWKRCVAAWLSTSFSPRNRWTHCLAIMGLNRVILGVGGGIAAYKSAELARALMQRDVRVQVVMTRGAQEFVRPLTFASLTGHKVITDIFSSGSAEDTLSSAVEHIGVAMDNDLLVVAPATADLLAKFAHGLADDFLSTLYLAFTGPVVLAPTMNTNMWLHGATQSNVETLRKRGHRFVEPESGFLACGMVGPGRLAEPERIAPAVLEELNPRRDRQGGSA